MAWKISPPTIFLKLLEPEDGSPQAADVRVESPSGELWRPLETDMGFLTGMEKQWRAEAPAANGLAAAWNLHLAWTGRKAAASRPRGSLVKESLLVKTSLPGPGEYFTVPTLGLVRAIPREIPAALKAGASFRYGEQARWQGPWEQPNHAAAVLATAALLIPAWLWRRRKMGSLGEGERGRPENGSGEDSLHHPLVSPSPGLLVSRSSDLSKAFLFSLKLAASVAFLWLLWHLALTYSRGGWAALAAGASVFALCRGGWRLSLGVLAVFALMLCLLPQGMERAGGAARLAQDGSIRHRLEFWRAALAMMARQPWSGVGTGNFSDEFQLWFARPEFNERVANAISDPLTLAAEHGLPGLVTWLFPLVFVLFPALRHLLRLRKGSDFIFHPSSFILSTTAACVAFVTAGLFSRFWDQTLVWPLPLACVTLLGLLLAAGARRGRSMGARVRSASRWLAIRASLTTLLLALAYGAGCWLDSRSARPAAVLLTAGTAQKPGLNIRPPAGGTKGSLCYILPPGESAAPWTKAVLRPLAEAGWEVWTAGGGTLTEAELEVAWQNLWRQNQASHPGLPCAVAGHGEGGLAALRLAAALAGLAEAPRLVAAAQIPLGHWKEVSDVLSPPRCEIRLAYATGESGPPRWASQALARELGAPLAAKAAALPGPWVKGAVCPATQAWVEACSRDF